MESVVKKIYNYIILKIYNIFFLFFRINDNQSLEYQIMIILMHIHRMKRFGLIKKDYGYVGDGRLLITNSDLKKIDDTIYFFLTSNNREILTSTNQKPLSFFGALSHRKKNEYYTVKEVDFSKITNGMVTKTIIFEMTDKGYSYQYNGYKKSEVRLQDKANLFAMFAIFGASFSWLVDKNFINHKSYLSLSKAAIIYLGIATIYFLRKKKLGLLLLIAICTVGIYFFSDIHFSSKDIVRYIYIRF